MRSRAGLLMPMLMPIWGIAVLFGSFATTAFAQKPPTEPAPGPIVIAEVMANPSAAGNDGAYEWIELANVSDADVTLAGWAIADAKLEDPLSEVTIPANGFAVVAGKSAEFEPDVLVVRVGDGLIGGGLNNDADSVVLRDADGREVDRMSYGGGSILAAGEGYSLVRKADGGWRLAVRPSPGAPNLAPSDAEIAQQFPVPIELQSGERRVSRVAWYVLGAAAVCGALGTATLLKRRLQRNPHRAA